MPSCSSVVHFSVESVVEGVVKEGVVGVAILVEENCVVRLLFAVECDVLTTLPDSCILADDDSVGFSSIPELGEDFALSELSVASRLEADDRLEIVSDTEAKVVVLPETPQSRFLVCSRSVGSLSLDGQSSDHTAP